MDIKQLNEKLNEVLNEGNYEDTLKRILSKWLEEDGIETSISFDKENKKNYLGIYPYAFTNKDGLDSWTRFPHDIFKLQNQISDDDLLGYINIRFGLDTPYSCEKYVQEFFESKGIFDSFQSYTDFGGWSRNECLEFYYFMDDFEQNKTEYEKEIKKTFSEFIPYIKTKMEEYKQTKLEEDQKRLDEFKKARKQKRLQRQGN